MLRPYASALPLGLLSFGVGMVLIGGIGLHWISGRDVALAGIVMASFVAPLELAATVLAFLGRDVGAATALGLFSTSWVATGVLHVISPPGSTSPATGLFLLAFAVMLLAPTAVALTVRPLLGVMLVVSTVRAVIGGVYQLVGSTGWSLAEGVAALVLAAIATYNGAAFLIEDALQRPLLPTGRRARPTAPCTACWPTSSDGCRTRPASATSSEIRAFPGVGTGEPLPGRRPSDHPWAMP